MVDLTHEMISLLSALDATVIADYPLEEYDMPVISVSLRESAVTSRAGGAPYAEESVYGVDVYASEYADALSLTKDADALLSAYGLRRTGYQFSFDHAARVYRAATTYRGVLRGDTIYQ